MNRRQFFSATGAGVIASVLPFSLRAATREPHTYPLTAAAGVAGLLADTEHETAVWQYNRQTPGPVIRVRQGEPLRIPFVNQLSQPTTIHWHGLRIPNAMDGVPGVTQPLIQPGDEFLYEFTPQDAGTFWYHTHNRTWEQLARGLYGTLIVEEREPIEVDRDLVLVIDDWRLTNTGQIDDASMEDLHDWAHGGRLGNFLTANGRPMQSWTVRTGERVRLRIINTANARIMPLKITGETASVIALDGQPVAPHALTSGEFVLAPAQRIDLVIDMMKTQGQGVVLAFAGEKSDLPLAELNYHPTDVLRSEPLQAPIALPPNPLPESLDAGNALQVSLPMTGGAMGGLKRADYRGKWTGIEDLIRQKKIWALNGIADLPEAPLFRARRGQTVVIDMDNRNAWPHAMHLHGHHFRLFDETASDARTTPWRDTTLLYRGDRQKIVFLADNPGKWLIHCHMIEHQAAGMVTWFEVA